MPLLYDYGKALHGTAWTYFDAITKDETLLQTCVRRPYGVFTPAN